MRRVSGLMLALCLIAGTLAGWASPVGAATTPVDSLAPLRIKVTPKFIGSAATGSRADMSADGQFVLYRRTSGTVALYDATMGNTLQVGGADSRAFAVSDRGERFVYSSNGRPFLWSRETNQSEELPNNGGLITDMALSQSGAVVVYTERSAGTSGVMRIWTPTRVRAFGATVTQVPGATDRDVFVTTNGQSVLYRSGSAVRQVAVASGTIGSSPLISVVGLNREGTVQVLTSTTPPARFTIGPTANPGFSAPTVVQYPQPSSPAAIPVVASGDGGSVFFGANDEVYRWQADGTLTYLQPTGAAPVGRPRDGSTTGRYVLTTREGTGDLLEVVDTSGPSIPIVNREAVQGPQISDQIRRLYLAYFNRPTDSGGLAYWTRQLALGTELTAVSAEFARSQEFQNAYGELSNEEFVNLVYNNVLGRDPDATGRAFWIQRLADGASRGEMMVGFSESTEFLNRTGTVAPGPVLANQIERLYRAYFNRGADQGGLDFWLEQFTLGAGLNALSGSFSESTEFKQTYGPLDDGQFVDLVYENVLGRAPDSAGRNFWLQRLASGATRGEMMTGFSESIEFIIATDTNA